MKKQIISVVAFLSCLGVATAQEAPTTKIEKLTPKLSVISAGFNGLITVLASEKGPVVVDTADPASAPAVLALIKTVDPRPPLDVILTHYHGDHAGGLATIAAGATVFAQEECLASFRNRDAQKADTALAAAAQVASLSKGATLQLGADTVVLVNPGPGHSRGDTVVVFEKEKVIAAGDLFFNGLPPYIDVADGADTAAWIATIESLCARYPGFKVVAGHGPQSDTAGWLAFAEYLRALREGVAAAIKAGQTREQAQASVNLDRFASLKDVGDFLTKKANVGWVYDELSRKK
jgi:cyclase